jgi:hypothetical protein
VRKPGKATLTSLAPADEIAALAPGRSDPLLCLCPIRNGTRYLPEFLRSIMSYCDGLVALDDGSTDNTFATLEGSPIVRRLIRQPRRPSYAGWDDSSNRQKLLDAAQAFRPAWALFLDCDELIPADDAARLRFFLRGANVRLAYGFEVFRMIGDLTTYDKRDFWAYRLFALRAGQCLPHRKLHFAPVPTEISWRRFRRTTFRIQHRSSLTSQDRAARYEKYRQADPDCQWQLGYDNLLSAPGSLKEWPARSPHWPDLVD